MNWTRKHTDKSAKHYKEWRAGRGRYRIIWRNQAFGVAVSSGYHCCVRVFVPKAGGPMWDFVDRNRRSLYRTFTAAKNACEKHANPDFKPAKKKRKKKKKGAKLSRKAPTKACPDCGLKIHARRGVCDCGHKFPKKVKRDAKPTKRT